MDANRPGADDCFSESCGYCRACFRREAKRALFEDLTDIPADESRHEPTDEACTCAHNPCDHTGCDCDGTFHLPGPSCPGQPTPARQDDEQVTTPVPYPTCCVTTECGQVDRVVAEAVAAERARIEALIGVIPGTRLGGADFIPRNAAMRAVLFGRTSS